MTAESDNTTPEADVPTPETETVELESVETGTQIEITDFQLSAGGRVLLEKSGAGFPAGKITLVLGCSGVGKSLLLKILAGHN